MPNRTFPCAQCGATVVTAHPRKIYCGRKCSAKAMNLKHFKPVVQVDRECPGCGTTFTPKRSDAVCCSVKCARTFNYVARSNWHTMICGRCAQPFVAKRNDAVYCSQKCSHRVRYEANRQARIKAAAAWATQNADTRRLVAARYKARRRIWEQSPRRYEISTRDWNRLMNRYRNACAYCQASACKLQVEHVIPLSRGGRHSIGNLLPACADCNYSKGSRCITEWRRIKRLSLSA